MERLGLALSLTIGTIAGTIAACAAPPPAPPRVAVAKERVVAPALPPTPPVEPAAPTPLFDIETPWPAATPEEVGLSRPALEKLIAECQRSESDVVLVLSGDRVVVARAFGHPLRPLGT